MLPGNRRMLEILGRSGLPIERTVQQGVEHVELRIAGRDFERS
jgi:hypothetical protein